jgi:DNA-binding transcriptional regulator YbjK
LASFGLGACVIETDQLMGEASKPRIKRCIGLVPLDGMVTYLADIDAVISRLTAAANKMVADYNARKVKKSLEWREVICAQTWTARGGRQERTVFQQELSTFAFHKNTVLRSSRPMALTDVKV